MVVRDARFGCAQPLERDVTIVPGLNPDLTVTLQATSTPR